MTRIRLLVASLGGGAILLSVPHAALAAPMQTRSDYTVAVDRASAAYSESRAKCASLAGHDKDMCVVNAKAAAKRARAMAEANYKGTAKARTDSRIADADADFMVAKVACNTTAGHEKDLCLKQASATHVKRVADATSLKASVDARSEARADTHEPQYRVALAKCDAASGQQKDNCVAAAKAAYAK